MVPIDEEQKEKDLRAYLRELGRKGGKATAKRFGKEHFAKIAAARKYKRGRYSPGAKGDLQRQGALPPDKKPADLIPKPWVNPWKAKR